MPPQVPGWADEGPVSQGKILTLILQGLHEEAWEKLEGWTPGDLRSLAHAASDLERMAYRVAAIKDTPGW